MGLAAESGTEKRKYHGIKLIDFEKTRLPVVRTSDSVSFVVIVAVVAAVSVDLADSGSNREAVSRLVI